MSLFSELKRRNVFKVAIAYLMLSWLILQIVDVVSDILIFPDWFAQAILLLLAIVFPIMLMFTWAFELTPQGIKKTDAIDEKQSTLKTTGQQINYTIITALVLIIGIQYWMNGDAEVEARENTIAVMAFADMSPDGSQEYFGDGIAEEILNVLVGIDELDVTSRTSSFAYKGTNTQIPEIAAELGVNYILEGSIRSDGDQVRVTAQLIDVANDTHLWSDTFDRQLTDIFAIQDEIGRSISNALRIELVGGEVLVEAPTENIEAYEEYLKGRQIFLLRGTSDVSFAEGSLDQAIVHFEKAIELDPRFAEAWAHLGASNILIPSYYIKKGNMEEYLGIAREAANRSISIDPELSQGWAVKGFSELADLNFQDAVVALKHATKLNPTNETPWLWLGIAYAAVGHNEKAIEAVTRAIEIAPNSPVNHSVLGRQYLALGQIEEAEETLRRATNEMNYEVGGLELAFLAVGKGEKERALEEILDYYQNYLLIEDDRLEYKFKTFIDARFDDAFKEEAMEVYLEEDAYRTQKYFPAFMLKDPELIIQNLETGNGNSGINIGRLYYPAGRVVLNQKRLKEYLISEGLLDYWKNNGFPSFCRAKGDDDFECQDGQGNWP